MALCRIIIIGGGFSGASAAVQLARKIADPIAIKVIEPAAELGAGLAYSTDDPVHRLNAITAAHSIDVADPFHFTDWCREQGLAQGDPDALVANGEMFVRRRDFRRYLKETVAAHAAMSNGSTITHVRERASDLRLTRDGVHVVLESGEETAADMAILAPGNPPWRQPAWASGSGAGHPRIFLEPMRSGLNGIPAEAKVLVVGAGLTALDIIASLTARGHSGPITAISRRGMRPQAQAPRILAPPADPPEPPVVPLDLLQGVLPDYVTGDPLTALELLRGMRRHAARTAEEGMGWQAGFDAVALPLSRIWPRLPLAEKQRVLRHLRPFYDAHRFRTPPMTDAAVRLCEAAGQVAFRKATIRALDVADEDRLVAQLHGPGRVSRQEAFDAVINCTGLDSAGTLHHDRLLASLHQQGMVTSHPTGLGIVTDEENRIVSASGGIAPQVRAIGALSAGVFGDPLGVFFISAQVHRLIPGMARQMGLALAKPSGVDR